MAIANRKFGVEIECYGASDSRIMEAFHSLGIECYRDHRDCAIPDAWKLTTDGSVRNDSGIGDSWEIVSPPLSGESGLEQINKVANALVRIGIRVNRSCGLHVHVDASDLSGADLANAAMRYAVFEQTIDGFMPQSRRDNTYCRRMSDVVSYVRRIENIETVSARNVASAIACGRYYKLNLQAFLRHGTIEFRQHSGTVNGTKITNWIRFCVNFAEHSKMTPNRYRETTETVTQNVNQVSSGSSQVSSPEFDANGRQIHYICGGNRYLTFSQRNIVRALNDGGMTVEQLAQVSNCAPASVPAMISGIRRVFGIGTRVLRKNRFSGMYSLRNRQHVLCMEYRRTVAPAIPVAPVVSETRVFRTPIWEYHSESVFDGMEPEIVSFYSERSMELSAS